MRNVLKCLAGLILLLAAASCWAGPFGFEYGMSKADVIKLVGRKAVLKEDGDRLLLSTAPKPHPSFESYLLVISPDKGLLKIVAMTPAIQSNDFGDEIKSKYDEVQKGLTSVYGNGDAEDFLQEGSDWTDAKYWMEGLFHEERTLSTIWIFKPVRDHIGAIQVKATAQSIEEGRILLTYEFEGFGDYLKAVKDKQNSVY